ncbi:MAG: insulinase family protein [Rhizobiaceae bacterium]|nr:insulinase family protein [Rhizobiaceae bacterium]
MKYVFLLLLGFVLPTVNISSAQAVEIQQFTTPLGIKVYLVENYTSPIITLSYSFAGGATQDPKGKVGATRLLAAMLDEGAGEFDGPQFQAKTEELGMEIGFSAGRDYFTGSMQTLSENSKQSFNLLRLALNQPRFDDQPMERMRQAMLLGYKRAENSPGSIAAKTIRSVLFKDHPYARPTNGNAEGVATLNREDLVKIHRQLLVKKGLVIGVVGAISQQELAPVIDMVFGDLPEKSDLKTITDASLEFGEDIKKQFDTPQSIISFALPGLKRSDPDFFAAYIVNHILGGGTFSSRLYNEVREKRGLAYSVYSRIATYSNAAFTLVSSATATDQVEKTIEIISTELKRMADNGPTATELEAAKKYIIGSYAIRNLDSSLKVASVLVAIQQVNLGIDYIDRRAQIINSVTLEDVKRVAAKLLKQKPTMVVVGATNS